MDYQKILDMLIEMEGELDDAYYSLPDYNANSDSQSYIDGARCTLYHLKDEVEKTILDSKKEPMGPDRLPLNFPFENKQDDLQ